LHSKACVAGIKKELGYYPKWDLKNGLEETIEYFHSQLHTHSV
jgi:nucleoside-diphosphate-sugar epimerase